MNLLFIYIILIILYFIICEYIYVIKNKLLDKITLISIYGRHKYMQFIKANNYNNLKRKLFLLYFLNVSDIVLTLLLLKTGYFMEVNSVMVDVVSNPWLSIFLKVFIVLILILFLCRRMKQANSKQLFYSNIIICFAVLIYILINLSHMLWAILLIR